MWGEGGELLLCSTYSLPLHVNSHVETTPHYFLPGLRCQHIILKSTGYDLYPRTTIAKGIPDLYSKSIWPILLLQLLLKKKIGCQMNLPCYVNNSLRFSLIVCPSRLVLSTSSSVSTLNSSITPDVDISIMSKTNHFTFRLFYPVSDFICCWGTGMGVWTFFCPSWGIRWYKGCVIFKYITPIGKVF